MDFGYDTQPVHDACHDAGCLPIIPLKKTTAVVQGKHKPPACEHGMWRFAGTDFKRRLTKWRCPSGECVPLAAQPLPFTIGNARGRKPPCLHVAFRAERRMIRSHAARVWVETLMLPASLSRRTRVSLAVSLTLLVLVAVAARCAGREPQAEVPPLTVRMSSGRGGSPAAPPRHLSARHLQLLRG
jgi:hypothetical protein